MDWLSKVEEERRQKAKAEEEASERQRRAAEEEANLLAAVREKLRPTLDPLVEDIERRLGLRLKVHLSSRELVVSAPKPAQSSLVNEHRVVFSHPTHDAKRIHVEAIRADRIHRGGEPPEGMTAVEYWGMDQDVVKGEIDVQNLVGGDLQSLMEWLVRTALEGRGRPPIPKIRTIPERKPKTSSGCTPGLLIVLGVAAGLLLMSVLGIMVSQSGDDIDWSTPPSAAPSPSPSAPPASPVDDPGVQPPEEEGPHISAPPAPPVDDPGVQPPEEEGPHIVVSRAAVIVYMPTQAEVDSATGDAYVALDDFLWHEMAVRRQLGEERPDIPVIQTSAETIQLGETTFVRESTVGFGFVLFAPDRAPKIIEGVQMADDLLLAVQEYFGSR